MAFTDSVLPILYQYLILSACTCLDCGWNGMTWNDRTALCHPLMLSELQRWTCAGRGVGVANTALLALQSLNLNNDFFLTGPL